MLIKNGNNIITSETGIVQEDKYLIGYGTPYNLSTHTMAFYLNVQVTDDVTIDWGDGSTSTTTWVGTSNPLVIGTLTHNYTDNGIYPIRLIYDNFENVTGIGLYGFTGISNYYKRTPNLQTIHFRNSIHKDKQNDYLSFYNNTGMTYIYTLYGNVLIDYNSIPDNVQHLNAGREYYYDITQVATLTDVLSTKKQLKILDFSNQKQITADMSVLTGSTDIQSIALYQTTSNFYGDMSYLKYNDNLRILRINGSAVSFNFKGHTFNQTITTLILQYGSEWNLDECFNSFNLSYTVNTLYTYGNTLLSGNTSDLVAVHPELSTLKINLLSIWSQYIWGDIVHFGRIESNYRFQLQGANLYGDVNSLNQPHITPPSIFALRYGKFYGDCTFMSGLTSISISMVNMVKHDTESFSNMEYIVDNSNRRNVYLNESELTTIELDSITNKLFSNRVIYNNSASKLYRIYDNTGYPTGTYQEPNKGSYSGNTNDLTENEIDNLVAGNDYDGGGSNTPWTVLEKIWILVNLDISSSNPTTRYYWSVTY